MKLIKLFAVVIFAANTSYAQAINQPTAQLVSEKISDNLYVIYDGNGQGANVGLIIDDNHITLVDCMTVEVNEKLLASIREISNKPIKYVINTHSDYDHAGGNQLFADNGTIIISQENSQYSGASSHVNFQNKLSIATVEAYHAPSHSPDDAIIYSKQENVVFMGDTFTNTWHPTFYSGGLEGQINSINLALSLGDENTRFIPGHGFVSDKDDLKNYLENTKTIVSHITDLHAQGLSEAEISIDQQYNKLLERFNGENTPDFIPETNVLRFVQRVLSTQLVSE